MMNPNSRTKNNHFGLRRKKGILIPIDDYQDPNIITIGANKYRYVGGSTVSGGLHGYYPVKERHCVICGKTPDYTAIYHEKDATLLERYCKGCSKTYTPIDPDFKLRVVK